MCAQERGGGLGVAVVRRPVKRGGSIRLGGIHVRLCGDQLRRRAVSPRIAVSATSLAARAVP